MENKPLEHYQGSLKKGRYDMDEKVLTVIQETEILGKKIRMYGSVEEPLFLASDVAEWIDYAKNPNGSRQTSKMVKSVDENEKLVVKLLPPDDDQSRDCIVLTEDGLYEVCMRSTKPIAKQMKRLIKEYLKSIRLTGAAIQPGREEEMISKYFPSFSKEVQTEMVKDLIRQNKELQDFYDQLMNTEGLMPINTVAKELEIGEYKLFAFLRRKKVVFYDKDMVNVPYERFRKEGKFAVKETPCHDGQTRSVTYATKKGLDYVRKLLRKDGYYDTVTG